MVYVVADVWNSYVGYCDVVVGVWDSCVGDCGVVAGVWNSYVGCYDMMIERPLRPLDPGICRLT